MSQLTEKENNNIEVKGTYLGEYDKLPLRLQGMTVIGKLWMTAANDTFSIHVSDGKNRLTLTISKDNLQDFIHDLNRVVEQ